MDERLKHGTMGPPTQTNPTSNQNQINAGNNIANKNSSQSSKRIINKIPLDFNKLKQAGLDRKLAEAISKRNKNDTNPQRQLQTHETLMSPASSSSSSSAAAAVISGEAAAAAAASSSFHSQPQQYQGTNQMSQRQPATQPIKKRSFISNYIEKSVPETTATTSASERSLHVKAMLKNRTLNNNKSLMEQQQAANGEDVGGTTYIYQIPKNLNTSPPVDFTVPIAKADLTVRPMKPPGVLNTVNQLPKQRAKCLQLPTASNQQQQQSFMALSSSSSTVKSPSPPLIVLENKVLAPNEKINLSDLRLPTTSMTVAAPHASNSTQENITDMTKVANLKTLSSSSSTSPGGGGGIKKKWVFNANKLKVSPEKRAEIAKEVCEQVKQVEQKPKTSTGGVSFQTFPNASPLQSPLISPVMVVSPPPQKTLFPSPVAAPPAQLSPEEPSSTSPADSLITPISVSDPSSADVTPEVKPKILSAVDYIAQLTANDPNYENSFMELSPEELEMSLHFGYTAPVRKSAVQLESQPQSEPDPEPEPEAKAASVPVPNLSEPTEPEPPKEDLAIGNIVKIQDIDILHATMDVVDGDTANILRISPNAIKLQSMLTSEGSNMIEPKDVEASNTIRVTKIKQNSEKDVRPQLKLSETSKTIKMKKAKINLVTRNKKPPIRQIPQTHNGQEQLELEKELSQVIDIPKAESQKPIIETKEDSTIANIEHNVVQSPSEEIQPKSASERDLTQKPTIETKEDSTIANVEHNVIQTPSEEIQPKSASERDLTQLYHPPKMPKLKNNNNNNNNNNNVIEEPPQAINNLSLIDIINQEPPPLQGEAQVPFRKEMETEPQPELETQNEPEPKAETETETSSKPTEPLGIQNLLNHLKSENITPPAASKAITSSSNTISSPTSKVVPRKKLVKTRPFLAKRTSKSNGNEETSAPIFPRNGSLLGEIQTNGTLNRLTSSSTSEDDGMFLAVLSKGKRVKHLKSVHETDISDDATPDYDETEGETESQMPKEKPKTDPNLCEENKMDVSMELEGDNSLDQSNHSWSEPMSVEEPSPSPNVIDPPKETEEVSAVEHAKPKIEEPVIINQKLDQSMEIDLPSVPVAAADVKPKKSPKSKNNKSGDLEPSPVLDKMNVDLLDTTKDKAIDEEQKTTPTNCLTNETFDKLMDDLKPKEEIPSPSKIKSDSPVRDTDLAASEETAKLFETEPNAPLDESSANCPDEDESLNASLLLVGPKVDSQMSDKQDDKDLSEKASSEPVTSEAAVEQPALPVNPPKRRGRKPKAAKTSQVLEQTPEPAAVEKEEQTNPPPLITPKRRGRKPRSLLIAEAAQAAEVAATTAEVKKVEPNPPVITPKRRGRKPRNPAPEIEAEVVAKTEEEPKPTSVPPLVTPKRRGRKPRNPVETVTTEPQSDKEPETELHPEPEPKPAKEDEAVVGGEEEPHAFATPLDKPAPKRRGRKPRNLEEPPAKKQKFLDQIDERFEEANFARNPIDLGPQNAFNLRLLLIRNREQLDSEEELREEGRGSGPLQCGLCLVRTSKDGWQDHLDEHYGIGWTTDEMPTSVSRSVIITLMSLYLKDNKAKGCTCRLCGRKLSSALGMVGHLENCGTTPQRFECEYCKRMYSKLSLVQHQRSCPSRLMTQKDSSDPGADDDAEQGEGKEKEPVYSNSGRAKRRSTIKAETKLKKIRVQMLTGDESQNPNDFEGDSSDYDMNKDKESSDEYESDGVNSSLADDENTTSKTPKVIRRQVRRSRATPSSRLKANMFSRYRILGDVVTKKWKQFTKFNYAKEPLYADCLPSYVKLSWTETYELLNSSRQTKSMRFAYDKVRDESDWRELKPLEAINTKNEYITYLGAPIRQLEWAPLPKTVSEQYLLCSLRRKMHGYTRNIESKEHNALMMLLKCTLDTNPAGSAKVWPLQTKLHYGIRVPKGPVFSFAFMPSGGYMESGNRLGLLAVTTASSDVEIYALPLQLTSDEVKPKCGVDSVIELNSLMTLCLDLSASVQDQCTKVCWSEASGHGLLVAGYASGNVALWDITDTEGLNCFKRNNHCSFVPLHYFFLGELNIQILNLHYDMSGPRWLAVGTSTRKLRVYDILNCSQPVPLVGDGAVNNFFKGCITWPPIWENIAIGCSSIFQIRFTRLLLLNPCGLLYNTKSLDYVLYTARDIHFNCAENYVIVVTENGDLVFVNPREMNMDPVIHKVAYNCRAVSCTQVSKLSPEESSSTSSKTEAALKPDDFQRDYGVIIKPLLPMPKDKKDDYLMESRRQNNELMTMIRLNAVRCNSNRLANNWVAVGAEHGMLRILHFQRKDFF